MFKVKKIIVCIAAFSPFAFANQPVLTKSISGVNTVAPEVSSSATSRPATAQAGSDNYDQQLKDLRKKLALAELRAKIAEQEKATSMPSTPASLPPPPITQVNSSLPTLSKPKAIEQSPAAIFEVRSIVGPKAKLVAEITYSNITGKFSPGDMIMNNQWRVNEVTPKYVQICGKKICENIGVSGF